MDNIKNIILAIASDKGGVAKTTTAVNLAMQLGEGRRILLTDADHQCNTTRHLLSEFDEFQERSLFDSLLDENTPLPIIRIGDNLDLIPASQKMFGIDYALISRAAISAVKGAPYSDPRGILSRILTPVAKEYDITIIDCPPGDNLMALNALFAATHMLIPVIPEPFSIQGAISYIQTMKKMNEEAHHPLQLAGILITNYETGAAGHALGERALRAWAKDLVYETRIRHSRPLYNAALAHQNIFAYAPESNGAKDYADFAIEFTNKLIIK